MNKKLLTLALILILSFISNAATSLMGPTGLLNVPSPQTVDKGFLEAGLHITHYSFGSYNGDGNRYSFKANFGIDKNAEIGFEKTIDDGNYMSNPGLTITGKVAYNLGENLKFAAGGIFDSDSNDYSSAYCLLGSNFAFFGFGVNFGGHEGTLNHAAFGGYNFDAGRPEDAFFLAGAEFKLNKASFTIGYNGDRISLGLRAPLESEQATVDIGWMSSGDYEDYYKQIKNPNYNEGSFIIGFSGEF
jgi:hypothetical protein